MTYLQPLRLRLDTDAGSIACASDSYKSVSIRHGRRYIF